MIQAITVTQKATSLLLAFLLIVLSPGLLLLIPALVSAGEVELHGPESATVSTSTPYATGSIDATGYENLELSFDYNHVDLDDDDSFTYVVTVGGSEVENQTIEGMDGDEPGFQSVVVDLSSYPDADDVQLDVTVSANTVDLDDLQLENILLTGDVIPSCDVTNSTQSTTHSTILDALDTVVDGDTLVVDDGSVCEGFVVNTNNLTIEAESTHGATISHEPTGTNRIVDIRANGVTIDGFMVESQSLGEGVGVSISGDGTAAANATVTNNHISGTLTGIQSTKEYQTGDSTIANNEIDSENVGISLQNSGNTVVDNTVTAALEGLGIGSTEWVLTNNVITGNTFVVEAGGMAARGYSSASASGHKDNSEFAAETLIADNDFNQAVYIAGGTGVCNAATDRYCGIFTDIQDAVDAAEAADTVVLATNFETTKEVSLDKALTLDGDGHTIETAFTKTSNSNNSAIGIGSDDVVVQNITVNDIGGGEWPDQLHGINIYISTGVVLDTVTATNFGGSGILVNGSIVNVSDVTTSGNGWHGINVDQGGGVTEPAILNISNISNHDENSPATSTDYVEDESIPDIFIDDVTADATVNDTDGQYITFEVPFRGDTARVYTLADSQAPTLDGVTLNGQTVDDSHVRYENCEAIVQTYPVSDEINLTAMISDDESDIASAWYKVRKVADNGCTQSSVFSSSRINLFADEDVWQATPGEEFNTNSIEAGLYSIVLVKADSVGNESARQIDIVVDNTSPQISQVALSNTLINSELTTLTADVSDGGSGVAKVQYKVYASDGSTVAGYVDVDYDAETNSVEDQIDLTGLADGEYNLGLRAFDEAGNKKNVGNAASSIQIPFTVDTSSPSITNVTLSNQANPTLTADINGTGSAVADVQYRIHESPFAKIDGFGWVSVPAEDGTYDSVLESISSAIDLTGLAEGDYLIRLRAFDEAGNKKSGVDVEFSITPPEPDSEENVVVFSGGGSLYQDDPDGEVLGVADIDSTGSTADILAEIAQVIANIEEAYAAGDIDDEELVFLLQQLNDLIAVLLGA